MLPKAHGVTGMLYFDVCVCVCVSAIVRDERMMLGYLGKAIMPPCRRMCPLQPKLCLPGKTHRAHLKKFSLSQSVLITQPPLSHMEKPIFVLIYCSIHHLCNSLLTCFGELMSNYSLFFLLNS